MGGSVWVDWVFVCLLVFCFLQIPAIELPFCENLMSNLRPWSVSGLRLWYVDLTNTPSSF